jgi:hypothetical protein
MLLVPTQAIPNQQFQVQLAGQACTIVLVQTAYGMFMTLYVGNSLIVASVIVENLNRIVRDSYLGFIGDFVFYDTQAANDPQDPVYTGLGSRYQLIYLEAPDLAAAGEAG